MIVLLAVLAASCGSASPAPVLDEVGSAELQGRAFERACQDIGCAGISILAPDSTPELVRAEISPVRDGVAYLSPDELADYQFVDGRFAGGATMITVTAVAETDDGDVRRVGVLVSRGPADFDVRTYLFRWDGSSWDDA